MPRPMYYPTAERPSPDPRTLWTKRSSGQPSLKTAYCSVGNTMTPYGERLSTVFLGMDHSFLPSGPTAHLRDHVVRPDPTNIRRSIFTPGRSRGDWTRTRPPKPQPSTTRFKAYTEKHYPHDQSQRLRYATEQEARESPTRNEGCNASSRR